MSRSRRQRRALCAAVALTAAVASAAPASATAPAELIVFQANAGNYTQLFTIAPDGTGLRQITRMPVAGDVPGPEQATWSPDGSTIAFDAGSGTGVNLFTVRADGSAFTELPLGVGDFNGAPAYSPDGRFVSFDQDPGPSQPLVHGIYVANADGSGARRLTTGIATEEAYDTASVWSPDGRRIAFTRVKNETEAAVFVVGVDGSGLKRLTPWGLDAANPDWSPDGRRILFNSYYDAPPGKSANLFVMRPDGSHKRRLTSYRRGRMHAFGPVWSPDGRHIVWHKVSERVNDLFVTDARGRHERRLTRLGPEANPGRADWARVG